ncbi:lytic murein transglycosylase [Bradyrhizobium sp. CB82]|uniref:lytic murein transglycosylase n=1 Tax=Bradyrhizobium sp. CB82 TaxID=3039159 RepID=UPI0024B10004|nr:lytic murein transglycosylase [Bradyrhizobium sp. CB82]WFU42346.1 lytic murein transglycosylase [Bradyrhizobium sp. CB82]
MRELGGDMVKRLMDKGCPGAARALLWILRRTWISGTIALVVLTQALEARADPAFNAWRAQLWLEAQARGVRQAVFDRATNVQLDLGLPDLVIPGRPVKEQAEFVKLPADYLPRQQLTGLARTGARHFQTYRGLLARIETDYGVPGNVVIAIWGRETDYGAEVQRHPVFQALVTQAYLGRRKDLFRSELLIALDLVQEGTISMDAKGSYTGAMGHTQFEPSDFLKFAADGDGDGKIDLERSIPDALASGAKQLRDYGWQRGKRWGFEVRLPPTVSCVESSPDIKRPLTAWLKLGVTPAGDAPVPSGMLQDQAQLVMPAGTYGPAFLVFANFQAIRSYNQSDVYALFVGHLADLIAGGAPFEKPWARLKPLRNSEVAAIQTQLSRSGYYSDAIDGRLGTVTRRAIGQYQQRVGGSVDCWPSQDLLAGARPASD